MRTTPSSTPARRRRDDGDPRAHRPAPAAGDDSETRGRRSVRARNEPDGAPAEVVVEGVRITNPGRGIATADGITKLDVVRYHASMAAFLATDVCTRPLALIRCPGGGLGHCFFQRHPDERMPRPRRPSASMPPYIALPTTADVIRAVQNGAYEFHGWASSLAAPAKPDRLTLDLDPDAALSWTAFRDACERVKTLLDALELSWFVKTTGGKGIHFVLPLERRHGFDEVKAFARGIAERLVAQQPSLFTSKASMAERPGRVFIDWLRNGEGSTAIAAYSLRARPGLPVAMPIAWSALDDDVRGTYFNVRNAWPHVQSRGEDPWAGYAGARQRIGRAQRRALGLP